MGLAKPALQFIAREHRRKPFGGAVLTLGRQGVLATLDEARRLLIAEQIAPAPLPAGVDTRTNIPDWQTNSFKRNTSDVAFFHLLGLKDVKALDYSAYEYAEFIHDLNKPVPNALRSRFDLIVDAGTLEHIFDIRQSLANIALMLKPGGRVIHITPANNYTNHGFYQFSPTLYFDYYSANAFADLRGFVAEQDTYLYDVRPWEFFEVTAAAGRMTSKRPLMLFFVAEKTSTSTADAVPVQSFYQQIYSSGASGARGFSVAAALKRWLPLRTKVFLARSVPWLDPMRKPWGLRRWGRLG
jgi:SAM-dependent methyltransferase